GLAGIRRGRTLTIVSRDDARTKNLPVRHGGDPELIPDNDVMVTQIIPVRHANAQELVEDLRALLPTYANMSSNESSNAIVLTDTQSSIRRMAEIVQALDQSISEISTLRVFQLRHADATKAAELIGSLFEAQATSGGGEARARQFFARFGRGGDNNDDSNR